jgi:hypothetical protein
MGVCVKCTYHDHDYSVLSLDANVCNANIDNVTGKALPCRRFNDDGNCPKFKEYKDK